LSSDLFLPDTSAVLTMLDNEEGADIVEDIIRKKDILFPSIVLFEVYYITALAQEKSDKKRKKLPHTLQSEFSYFS